MKRRRLFAISISLSSLVIFMLLGSYYNMSSTQAEQTSLDVSRNLLNAQGFITLLRVHDVGTGYGPLDDLIDGEVVIRIDGYEGAFGFQLRDDANRAAHEGMLNLLRDAFNNDWIVNIDFWLEPGKVNGEIIRVWITKPVFIGEELD